MVYSIIVIYFSNTNSASASLDSAIYVRTADGERTRICAVYRVGREFVNASWNRSGQPSRLHTPLVSLWLVFARDETNGTPDE